MRAAILLPPFLALLLTGAAAHAQSSARAGGQAISGVVLESESGLPLGGATVVLEPSGPGAFPSEARRSGFVAGARGMQADSLGGYRFTDVAAGRYELHAFHVGYKRYSVGVEVREGADVVVSLALTVSPVELSPVDLATRRPDPFLRRSPRLPASLARAAAGFHAGGTIAMDAVELTLDDVVHGVTLGEPDLFRAIQRLPGVGTRSDYTAELWTRGAPWDHTRVYFDGVPLFNPLHALGAFSGLGPGAVGGLWLHPGVQPTSLSGGAAASVDLRTRRGGGQGRLNGAADLSLVSASLSLDQETAGRRVAWMASGRRTYLDWLSDSWARMTDRSDVQLPYAFADAVARVDAALGRGWGVEASGLWQHDGFSGEPVAGSPARRADWGNSAGRLTLSRAGDRYAARHTVGFSRHSAVVRDSGAVPVTVSGPTFPSATESGVALLSLTGEWRPTQASEEGGWSAGYAVERHAVRYDGLPALPVPRLGAVFQVQTRAEEDALTMDADLTVAALWGERLWRPGEKLLVQAGLRVEGGSDLWGSSALRPAPRLSLRYQLADALAVSAGWGRSFQYAQALAPSGVHLASLSSTLVWLLAGPGAPVLTSDVLSVGGETWLGDGWRVGAQAFARRSTGLALPDPRPGPAFDRPVFVPGEGQATGLELSARKLTGRWTGSVGYTLGVSEVEAEGLRFPAAADRRHALDATLLLGLAGGVRAGGALTAASGIPFTRVLAGPQECPAADECAGQPVPWLGPPNDARAPAYASLDLLVDWSGTLAGREVGGYVQLRNALGRDNSTVYLASGPGCIDDVCGPRVLLEERRERGLPRLPIVGVRARF